MSMLKVEHVAFPFEVDVCGKCHGFFLDRGEAGRIAGGRDLEKLLHAYAGDRGPASCPGCGERMRLRTLKARGYEVTVDVCPKCRGTWLDDHELLRLKEAYEEYLRDANVPPRPEPPSRALASSTGPMLYGPGGFAAMTGWALVVR